ncbi:MAG: hypothetical protein LBU34_03190 [Planctomycetaceae bacterium]|jgi:hypothetical protein|nr:hypothetical protein [Planctomycetaceae bacterium]
MEFTNPLKKLSETAGNLSSAVTKLTEKPPIPDIDIDGIIGKLVLSEHGGTTFWGTLPKEFNLKLPENLIIGKVQIFLHENGIRIEQKKGYPILIVKTKIEEVSIQRQSQRRRVGVAGDLVESAVDGAIGGGLLGAGLAVAKSSIKGEAGTVETIVINYIRITFVDDNNTKWCILIETEPVNAEQFMQRYQEISQQ